MKRLRDEIGSRDAKLAEAARLASAARNLEPPPGLEGRIRARLLETPRRKKWQLRPAFAALLVILATALAASAATGRFWPLPPKTTPSAPAPHRRSTPKVPRAEVVPAVPKITPPREEPVVREKPVVRVEPVVQRAAPPRIAVHPPVAAPSDDPDDEPLPMLAPPPAAPPPPPMARPELPEAILVAQATRALHAEHRPKRALQLLDDYLRLHPDGDLVEECLALQIEARSDLDDARAAALADEYLRRFPGGRFGAAALAARQRFHR
jgi:hypothetical protein